MNLPCISSLRETSMSGRTLYAFVSPLREFILFVN